MKIHTKLKNTFQQFKSFLDMLRVSLVVAYGIREKLSLACFFIVTRYGRIFRNIAGGRSSKKELTKVRKFKIRFQKKKPFDVYLTNDFGDTFVFCEVFGGNDYGQDTNKKPHVIFDLGANIGLTALKFHAEYPNAHIYCFEPDAENFTKLIRNVSAIKEIKAFKFGISDRKEVVSFYRSKDFHMRNSMTSRNSSDEKTSINCISLDEAINMCRVDHVDFMKFDIEGAEIKALNSTNSLEKVYKFSGELHPYLWDIGEEEKLLKQLRISHDVEVRRIGSKVFVSGTKVQDGSRYFPVESIYGKFLIDPVRDKKILDQVLHLSEKPLISIRSLEKFISNDSVVIDIGAHIGTFSIPVSHYAGKVFAFEPSPKTYSLLEENIKINLKRNIESRKKGLGASSGNAELGSRPHENAGGQTLHVGNGSIEISTLDKEIHSTVDIIKIDVEGMEIDVLNGGKDLIKKYNPVIFFEVNLQPMKEHDHSLIDLERFLFKYGYKLYYPFFKNGDVLFGKVSHLSLVTGLITPRSFFLNGPSMPFDIIAIPNTTILPKEIVAVSEIYLLIYLLWLNLHNKITRLYNLVR